MPSPSAISIAAAAMRGSDRLGLGPRRGGSGAAHNERLRDLRVAGDNPVACSWPWQLGTSRLNCVRLTLL